MFIKTNSPTNYIMKTKSLSASFLPTSDSYFSDMIAFNIFCSFFKCLPPFS